MTQPVTASALLRSATWHSVKTVKDGRLSEFADRAIRAMMAHNREETLELLMEAVELQKHPNVKSDPYMRGFFEAVTLLVGTYYLRNSGPASGLRLRILRAKEFIRQTGEQAAQWFEILRWLYRHRDR